MRHNRNKEGTAHMGMADMDMSKVVEIDDTWSNLYELFGKKASRRVELLSAVIRLLTDSYQSEYADTNFATLLYGILHSFKKGSLKESCLACQAIELLAITIGCGGNAQELYRESLSAFSQALQKKCEPAKLASILESLAIVTLICGDSSENNSLETECSMELIWDIITATETGSKVVANDLLPSVKASAISSWTLLLAAADNWLLKIEYWNRVMNGLLNMLETDNVHIALAATEALGVIFEIGYLEKFLSISKYFENEFSTIEELKENIIDGVKNILSKPEVERLPNKQAAEYCLKLFEDDCFPETSAKIGKSNVKIDKLSKLLQMNFVKRLLGSGFATHILGNERLHGALNTAVLSKKEKILYVPERVDVVIRRYMPRIKKPDLRLIDAKDSRVPTSRYRKATTQLLNKHRSLKDTEMSSFCKALDD